MANGLLLDDGLGSSEPEEASCGDHRDDGNGERRSRRRHETEDCAHAASATGDREDGGERQEDSERK